MILARLLENLRAQNWSTMLSELLVLIVGIFLGFQLDDWNDERKDREL
jgi:uncharacterized membrane protein HdeD (DUF308 family)